MACAPLDGDGLEHDQLLPISLPTRILLEHTDAIAKGNLFLTIHNGYMDRSGIHLRNSTTLTAAKHPRRLMQRMHTVGNQTVALIRVSTNDASPNITMHELEESIFGSGISVKTQYQQCSGGQLHLEHSRSIDLHLNASISLFGSGSELLDAARDAIVHELHLESLGSLADRVIFCLAPTPGWVARTAVNHYRVVINGEYCQYLHVKMHELGHAIGLTHAGMGERNYGDLTAYMGGTTVPGTTTSPQKCFNAYHHYELGWYSRHHLVAVDLTTTTQVKLASFVDYDRFQSNESVIVNIDDTYYLQYNRKALFNTGTEAMGDRVVVIQDWGSRTDLVAGLDVDDRLVLPYNEDTGSIVVEVLERVAASEEQAVETMILRISTNNSA